MTSTNEDVELVTQIPLEEEYKKPTGITPADIQQLRTWLQTQPHLPAEYITDLDLILTYHCCGRSSEVSKQLLDVNLTLRTLFTSFYKDRTYDARIKQLLEKVLLFAPLPTLSKDGNAVFYAHFLDNDAKNFVLADACRACLMRLDLWQYEEGTIPGFLYVIDLDGMTLGHLAKLDLPSVQQFLYFLQQGILLSLKGLHFLNAPSFMDRLMMILRPFLQKELLSMLHIHQVGSNNFEKFFPLDQLPKGSKGGNGRSIEDLRQDTLRKMEGAKQFFIDENKKRVVESKRPGRPKTISDIFGGVEGSFKKLDID